MNFLAPAAFFLGLLLPVIVAMYLLKLRRVEREVPSTYLWRRMVRDVEANAPWQRLRPNLLLILQLLFLAALIFALARPYTLTEGVAGDAAIIVLDTSASMAATDAAPSRIESAKAYARQLIDDLPDSARLTIIEAGKEARVLLSSSLDRRQAYLAVQRVRAGSSGSDMQVAIELASAIAARQTGAEIIVLSDGRVDLPDRLALRAPLRYIPFGLNGENQAVSLLTLESTAGGGLTGFAQVSNYGQEPASRRLSIYADQLLINVYDLADIPAGGLRGVVIDSLPAETRQLTASLNENGDILGEDDSALAALPDRRPVAVTLYTPGNLFLQTALSLLPNIDLTVQTVQAEEDTPDSASTAIPEATAAPTATAQPTTEPSTGSTAAQIVIYDRFVPDMLPQASSLVFIAPPKSTDFFTTTGLVETPAPRAVDAADPLLQNVVISEVSILDAVQIPLPGWATPVIAGDVSDGNIALLFRGETQGRRIVVQAFDLFHSDLQLQIAFPLLWANLVDWLAPGAGSPVPDQVAPGEVLVFPAPEGADTALVQPPQGPDIRLQAENGQFVLRDTDQLGLYQIQFTNSQGAESLRQATFTVNLFSPLESNLNPADELPGLSLANAQANFAGQQAQREWWRPLAMLALGLLVGEWLVYQRGALARLRDWLRDSVGLSLRRGKKKGIG